jgi:hypothetical protein
MNRILRHLTIGLAAMPSLAWAQAPTPLPVVASFSILGDEIGRAHV